MFLETSVDDSYTITMLMTLLKIACLSMVYDGHGCINLTYYDVKVYSDIKCVFVLFHKSESIY